MGVEFQEEDLRRDFGSSQTPKLAAWLIKRGMASDLATANKIQVGAAIVFIVLAIIIYLSF